MKIPNIIKETSKKLRNNMTESEIILWSFIKGGKLGIIFLRQKPMYVYTEYNGQDRFIIPDFYCHEMKIILEIDGSVHNLKEIYLLDKYKKELLNNKGYKVIRIKNEDIKNNINDVLKTIKLHL
ncbi:MAG: endonuclease domain-containing protein [Candidatus Gracilibacteria bacterium]|nr:endonuclease domain-containing protein [Candidatus Gracilibacteria bacterium]